MTKNNFKIFSVALNLHDHNTYDGIFHNRLERFTRFKHNVPYYDNTHIKQNFNEKINFNDHTLSNEFVKKYFKKSKDIILSFSYTNGGIKQAKNSIFNTVLKGHEDILNFIPKKLFDYYFKDGIYYIDHHQAHATYAFINSGFNTSDILAIDGNGAKFKCIFINKDMNIIDLSKQLPLGWLWDQMSKITGFGPLGASKLMGLVGYGKFNQYYYDLFQTMIENDVTFQFPFYIQKLVNLNLKEIQDLAFSLQKFTIDKIKQHVYPLKSCNNICLSGGVAYNGYINEKFAEYYENVYVPPAVGDEGQSLGVYQHADYILNKNIHKTNVFSGREHKVNDKFLKELGFVEKEIEDLYKDVAKEIANGKIVGWYQAKSESGNRALGNRSILADPRNPNIKDLINKKIKKREDFRPFAPAVLEEHYKEYFNTKNPSPYMSRICKVKTNKVPGVTHTDNTARIQTVNKNFNEKFYNLINEFYKITGIPMLLNTSFNCNEPIVELPIDAINTFKNTELDVLVIGNYILKK